MKVEVDLILHFDNNFSINTHDIDILKSILKTNSITQSANELGISYKNIWDRIKSLGNNLIISKKNKGSFLADKALEIIKIYDNLKRCQNNFLSRILDKNINLEFIPEFYLELSARNKLKLKITEIKHGIINSEVLGSFKSGKILRANITNESLKNMNLKVGDEVYFIFKAPKALISKDDIQNSVLTNILKIKITSAVLGEENAGITGITKDNEKITALIPNDTLMDLRLKVNDEIAVIIDPNDIILAI